MCNALCGIPSIGLDVLSRLFGHNLNDIRAQENGGFILSQYRPDTLSQLISAQYQQYKPKKLPPIPPRACPLHWRKPEDRP